ncbi:endonuclease domain-containing protein [Rubricoccus marinus]|uniref:DUF559 domain-containing protein n=1 Tax=Rubricoccus marinus TaxID=716817 RepID=A0A259TWP0_9BACT|nr:DUF559 domain-containing protein [Rubricoccus marinus]OZC02175.1 hypothetical protein BSZ36_03735 [Rubricoccus marinus]
MPRPRYDPSATPFARRLRRDATFPERLLWSRLRRRQLGVRVLRQRPVGRYVVDFLAPDVGLVVEVDGRSHDRRMAHDAARERYLVGQGLRVIRVTNDEVVAELDAVIERICSALGDAPEDSGKGETFGGSEES